MPFVAGDVAAAGDLAIIAATAIELEVQVGASPQLCTRRQAPRPERGMLELPPLRMYRMESIVDGGGRGIGHNNERMAKIAESALQNIFYSFC